MTARSDDDGGRAQPAPAPDAIRPAWRVGILIGSLEAGGAQRMALALAHDLLRDGWDVRLMLLNPDREMALPGDPAMQAALEARLEVLGGSSVRTGTIAKALRFPRLHRRLAHAVARHRLAVVVSFMERANLLNLLRAGAVPRVISVRKQISVSLAEKSALKRTLVARAYPLLLRRAAAIVLNAHASAADFARRFGLDPDGLTVIPNAVDPDIERQAAAEPSDPKAGLLGPRTLVTVGRLVPAKGQAPLLRAFAQVVAEVPDARLVLVGDGPLRAPLGVLAEALGIADRVAFAGFQPNPYPWMARAGAFALPSRGEGFPNALLEAMYLGRACVAADCPSGPRELIAPETPVERTARATEITEAGVLVPPMPEDDLPAGTPLTPSEDALARSLVQILSNDGLRRRLQAGAGARAAAFTPARARAAWQAVIADSLNPDL
jgi:glycosyltransferase involved in cell wall biosynthesis